MRCFPAVRAGLFVVLGAVAAVLVPATGADARLATPFEKRPWPADAVEGSLLVTADDAGTAASLAGPSWGRVARVTVAPGTEAAAAADLREVPGVVAVEPDRWRPMLRVPDDDRYPDQISHAVGRTADAWDVTTGSSAVRVAVIDSGVDGRHPDLRGNLVSQADVSSGAVDSRALGSNNDTCGAGHGTLVAGIVGAIGDNGTDVAGVAWDVGIIDVAAADPLRCAFSDAVVVGAVHHAVDQGADVINLSLGGPGDTCPTAMQAAIDAARSAGAVVVAASGNFEVDLPGVPGVPASCDGVLSVGAVAANGQRASYSTSNAWVDVVAAGGDPDVDEGVLSTALGGGTAREYGTSFAAPYVAGVAALLRTVDPALTPDEVEDHLEASTGRSTRSTSLGWGIVDAGRAVDAVDAGTVARHRPDPSFPVGLVIRVSDGDASTDPVRQAVAMSSRVFEEEQAEHVVLGRADDFADALAGSSLGFGAGPLLFTGSTGPLASPTRNEIQRVLRPDGRVYLVGGTAALPPTLESEITALGYDVRRLAGRTREETAAAVSEELLRRLPELGFAAPDRVLLVTSRNWPDAVTAGSLGAFFGYPILLTPPGALHPAARWALGRQKPSLVYVVGGDAAVSPATMSDAQGAAGSKPGRRLAGVDRNATAVAVALEFEALFEGAAGIPPQLAVAVNLRRPDAFAHVLSASSAIGAQSGVFVPIEGNGGTSIPPPARDLACRADPFLGLVAGGTDVVSQAVQQEFNTLLEDGC